MSPYLLDNSWADLASDLQHQSDPPVRRWNNEVLLLSPQHTVSPTEPHQSCSSSHWNCEPCPKWPRRLSSRRLSEQMTSANLQHSGSRSGTDMSPLIGIHFCPSSNCSKHHQWCLQHITYLNAWYLSSLQTLKWYKKCCRHIVYTKVHKIVQTYTCTDARMCSTAQCSLVFRRNCRKIVRYCKMLYFRHYQFSSNCEKDDFVST